MSSARLLAHPRVRLFAPIVFICIAACALAISTYSEFGHTWDEPEHLAAGIALLDTGEYPYDAQHPPLARIAMALGPFIAGARSHGNAGPSGEQEGREILYGDHYDLYLTLARIGMLPFLVALLLAAWLWTRRLFGDGAAVVAAALLATTPVVIGHAAVAALDVPMVGTTLLALYLMAQWFDQRTLKRTVAFGLAAGIAAGTKLSSIPFIGCVALVWFIVAVRSDIKRAAFASPHSPPAEPIFSLRTLGHAAVATGIAALAMCACFGFILEHVVESFTTLLEHNKNGHLSYFMGELRRNGWWNFYLVALALKTPIPLLATGLAGSIWLLSRAVRERLERIAQPALAWIVILVFASAYSHINIGVRHVLIVYPLLAINAAALIAHVWNRHAMLAARAIIALLLGWQTIGFAVSHPDYLAYFNEFAGRHPERVLIDSDLDWGQDVRRLKKALSERHITHFAFVYRGTVDLQREGFPSFQFLWPGQRATGWIAVSLLAKATGSEDGGYDWLNAYQPVARIGKSIDLYYIGTRDK